ncbi:MAG: hypothetical protein KF791_18580 [Verrucomicrobiae bacterium]|nr:hypothetical protein [Verrucomicrobiae bacterium]
MVVALVLSVLLHLYSWLMVLLLQAGLRDGWIPGWMRPAVEPVVAWIRPPDSGQAQPAPDPWREIPLQFVEVDPLLVTDEAPPDTSFYSTANTLAANPDPPKVDLVAPKVDGRQENSLKTFDTTQPSTAPPPPAAREVVQAPPVPESPPPPTPTPTPRELEPAPVTATAPEPQVAREVRPDPELPVPETQPKPAPEAPVAKQAVQPASPPPGELVIAKVAPAPVEIPVPEVREFQAPQIVQPPQSEPPAPEPVRPRRMKTLAEARAAKGAIVGERMQQEGGVQRAGLQSSLNVKASPLGDYNYRMVLAVQERWYRLLEERRFALERQGQVVITFNLHDDGTITSVTTKDSNVGDVLSFLCELSVLQPAPFGRWPPDVRRLIGSESIPVTFTFNYN